MASISTSGDSLLELALPALVSGACHGGMAEVEAWRQYQLSDVAAKLHIYGAFIEVELEVASTWPSRLTTCISRRSMRSPSRGHSGACPMPSRQRLNSWSRSRRFGPRPSSPGSRRLRENRLVSAWPGRGPPGALREFERAGENTGTFIEARHRRLGRAGRARPARERAFARAGFRLTKETICGLIVHWRTSGPSCISRALTANIGSYPASARSS